MNKTNIPQYLAEHGELTYRIVGVSMNPLLRQDRDLITVLRSDLAPKDTNGRFHNHEVVLYKRHSDGAYVLHRIVEVRVKRLSHRFYRLHSDLVEFVRHLLVYHLHSVNKRFVRSFRYTLKPSLKIVYDR